MKRFIHSTSTIMDAGAEWLCEVDQREIPIWCLELALLQQRQCSELKIVMSDSATLVLEVNGGLSAGEKAELRQQRDQYRVSLEKNQLDFLLAVLLRAYRDQCAEVDHIHIEGVLAGEERDLTLLFSHHAEPMTPEEAAKLMQ